MEMKNEWMWHEDFYEVYFWGEMNVDWHSMWLLRKNIKISYKNMNMPMYVWVWVWMFKPKKCF